MRSPTAARLWEIWQRNRIAVAVIVGATIAGRLVDYAEQPTDDPSSLIALLWMVSFLFLFGIFSYTESSGTRGIGSFPRRLFTLPVSSLRLVTLPVLTGIASVELLYLLWLAPLSRGGSLSPPFAAVLLGAFMVFFQGVFWMLERLGPLRLMVAGLAAVAVYGVGLLPSWPPSPPSPWRSEAAVGTVMSALAVFAFLLEWRHISRLRCGGGGFTVHRLEPLMASATMAVPRRRRPLASPMAAQFWFEWRCAGLVLPVLVCAVLVAVVAPFSWFARYDASGTLRLLLGTIAAPIILAIPVGMAFARPAFWSEDLSVPPFVAVRPLTNEQIVAIKLKVAAASVAISWLLVVCFVGVWFSLWANVDAVSQLASQWSASHEHPVFFVYTTVTLILIAGLVLTWRFLVSRLWSGLSGSRPLFMTSVLSVVLVVIAGLVFAVDRLPGWLLGDPARMRGVVWLLSVAVVAKCGLAAYAWRRLSARHLRQYLLVWSAGTASLVTLAMWMWSGGGEGVMIRGALLVVPLGRIGLAPSFLARNRHR